MHPGASHQVDFEVELAVVIGKILRHAPAERVMQCIAGYTILHDVSARDVQFKDGQITLGKNFDTFAPMGPCMVTADELLDPANLRMRTLLNGEVMQDGNTRELAISAARTHCRLVARHDAGARRCRKHRDSVRDRRVSEATRISSAGRYRRSRH